MSERDPNELGALWIKQGPRGEYMTGEVNGVAVVVFRNDRKPAGSKAPDWRVMKSQPRDGQQRQSAPARPAAAAAKPARTMAPLHDDDIPW